MPEEVPIINPTEAVDLLTQLVDSDQWTFTEEFALALGRLNGACARQQRRAPTPDDDGGDELLAAHA